MRKTVDGPDEPEIAIQLWGARRKGSNYVGMSYSNPDEVALRPDDELVTAWITPWQVTDRP